MNTTSSGNRKHIVFYGKRNVGKSSLMNRVLGQEISLVSNIKGTTTDPVSKAMELKGLGPVLLVDTGGIDDQGSLGRLRVEKTKETLSKADLAVYVLDGEDYEDEYMEDMLEEFTGREIPYILVVNKSDLVSKDKSIEIDENFILTSVNDEESIEKLRGAIVNKLSQGEEETIIGDLVPHNGKIILVIDNDSAAPKGRLILPQVEILRDALDNGIKSYLVRKSELESALEDLAGVDLVITDSKIFKEVDEKVKEDIKLTSFSILMARKKGDLKTFLDGVKSLEGLRGRKKLNILIGEACTHTVTHEDIGQVKIPNMLRNYIGEELNIEFVSGGNLSVSKDIDLVIHCGACMINEKNMQSRISQCREMGIPITNYGIFISFILGILDRAVEVFDLE